MFPLVPRLKVYDPDPEINERIRRAVRYGQTRWAEIWLSIIAIVFGVVLLIPGDTFSLASFRIIALFVSEDFAGWVSIFFGAVRIVALIINGRRGRQTSLIRTLGCIGGFFFWTALGLGFAMAMPPVSTGLIYLVFAAAELHASSHAASDMAAEDTFGFRSRRRKNGASHAGCTASR